MKIAREIANKRMEEKSQVYEADCNEKQSKINTKKGTFCCWKFSMLKEKRKLANWWDCLYKIIKLCDKARQELKKTRLKRKAKNCKFYQNYVFMKHPYQLKNQI
jgi:predicted house-cleaning noncanonical NTP pyrophosphatase (MazG superfamily)